MVNSKTNHTDNVFFTTCLPAHVNAIHNDANRYISEVNLLLQSGTFSVVPSSIRCSIMVALHATSQTKSLTQLMRNCDVKEIEMLCRMVDSRRVSRHLEKKIQQIEKDHPHLMILPSEQEQEADTSTLTTTSGKKRKSKRKIDVYRSKLRAVQSDLTTCCQNGSYKCVQEAHDDSAVQEILQSTAGASGALARKVKQWAKTIPSDDLEFVMLTMPDKSIWKRLADVVHFCPTDFCVPYFLADVHGETIPETSFVATMRAFVAECSGTSKNYTEQAFLSLAKEFPQVYLAYPFLRTQEFLKRRLVYEELARQAPLEDVLWNFEEFYKVSSRCEEIARKRLQQKDIGSGSGNAKLVTYGKLMERILRFRAMGLSELADALVPLASGRLEELKSYWRERAPKQKVAVIGDASSSMQCAIDTATSFASLVSVCFHGRLTFYNHRLLSSPYETPQNVDESLEVCTKIRASGTTAPAVAVAEYVKTKTLVDLIVHVTDELENTSFEGGNHARWLSRYKKEVNPNVQLVIVCVGAGYRPFRNDLDASGVEYKVVTIDQNRPDLAKFEALLGQLAMASDGCAEEIESGNAKSSEQVEKEEDEFVVI